MTRKERMSSKLLLIVLTVCCFGCTGGGNEVDLGTVSGVVTMDGKPLADAIVVFAPAEGNPSTGRTDTNGSYELSYLGNAKGAILGNHKVSITTGEFLDEAETIDGDTDLANVDLSETTAIETPPDSGESQSRNHSPKDVKKETIPAKYNSQTELKADVKAGANTFNFDLVSK
jgi:hypothetical protein